MRCPFCKYKDSRVLDTRMIKDGTKVRRRRECIECNGRFTTFEQYNGALLMVVKKNKRREPFDIEKIKGGIFSACNKRAIKPEAIDKVVESIEDEIRSCNSAEIKSEFIGEIVMGKLKKLDEVAYIRFASICKEFKKPEEFIEEAQLLETE